MLLRLRRGTPCDVRPAGPGPWRRHVCSADTQIPYAARVPYNATPHWVFEHADWHVRVAVPLLEVADAGEDVWHVGATATREGIGPARIAAVRAHLQEWLVYADGGAPTLHHGGEAHGDRDIHRTFRDVYGKVGRVVIHPASDQPAHLCDWTDADEVRPPLPSLERNREIVDAMSPGAVLLACPRGANEEVRSGTWATVRFAEKTKRGVLFFWPDGLRGGR